MSKFSEWVAIQAIKLLTERTTGALGCGPRVEYAIHSNAATNEWMYRGNMESIDERDRQFPSPHRGTTSRDGELSTFEKKVSSDCRAAPHIEVDGTSNRKSMRR